MDACEYALISEVRAAWAEGIRDEQEAQRTADAQKQASA